MFVIKQEAGSIKPFFIDKRNLSLTEISYFPLTLMSLLRGDTFQEVRFYASLIGMNAWKFNHYQRRGLSFV